MRAVDNVILARLKAVQTVDFKVYDGDMEIRREDKAVTYGLPFAVYYSSVGDDENRRLDGRTRRLSVFFSITYVGIDREQAKWAGERIRARLNRQKIDVPGYRTWLCQLQESQRVRRDDEATRPDGRPLFYGVDSYALSITPITAGVRNA